MKTIYIKLSALLHQYPGRVCFMVLLLFYAPSLILFYPGLPNGDNIGQLAQGFGAETLTNHHPVLHTLLLQICMQLGRCMSDDNIGLYLYVMIQNIALCAILIYCLRYLIIRGIRTGCILLLLLYYCVNPILHNYSLCVVKDTWYGGALLLLLVQLHKYIVATNKSIANEISILLCFLGMTLIRNDGIYMSLLMSLMIFLLTDRRRSNFFKKIMLFLLLFSLVWNQMVLPMAGVKKGSSREMLSLPFQQTARYIRDYSDEVTDEEKKYIDRVLDYDELSERYDPVNADPVKITFKENASAKDITQYFKCWIGMFFKHPMVYIQATWENKNEFFLPLGIMHFVSWKDANNIMERISREIPETNIRLSFPNVTMMWRNRYENVRECVSRSLPFLLLRFPCFYIWWGIGGGITFLIRHQRQSFVFFLPFLINFLINIAGPMNGTYTRYMYLYIFTLPIATALGILKEK